MPDNRLLKLATIVKDNHGLDRLPPQVHSTVEFIDIAGLIAGAHKGEGLGNKFLSHIRETKTILHVVRNFNNPDIVKEGNVDPASDLQTIETELILADIDTIEKQKQPKGKVDKPDATFWSAVTKIKQSLEAGHPARRAALTTEESTAAKQLSLLTAKPILVALNIDEAALSRAEKIETDFAQQVGLSPNQVIALSAKLEEELATLTDADRKEYLGEHNISADGLERIITKAFATLGLITFLTAGEIEVRAWTIPVNTPAPHAAAVIHTDFEKNFIKAQVCSYDDYIAHQGLAGAKAHGKVRTEGRDYLVKGDDIIEFMIGK